MIEAIFILLGAAIALFIIALVMREAIVAIFASFLFLLGGLSIITNGFGDMVTPYTTWAGIIFIAIGGYIAIKSGFEIMGVGE